MSCAIMRIRYRLAVVIPIIPFLLTCSIFIIRLL